MSLSQPRSVRRAERSARSAALLVLGAAAYAVLVGWLGLSFHATPLLLGMAVLLAGAAGGSPGLVPPGLALVGWGAAVLVAREGGLAADRESAAFLVGAALGMAAASTVARLGRATASDTGAAVALLVAGLAVYLAADVAWLNEWITWTGALLVWAVWEARAAHRSRPPGRRRGRRRRRR